METSDFAFEVGNEFEPAVESSPRPFLKWAGGKRRLLKQILARMPRDFDRYVEPFVGGGAVFFALQPKAALLCDINAELINTFTVVRDKTVLLLSDLERHKHSKKYFYKIRAADRSAAFWTWSDIEKASRLIYLNHTCYNGLYRVNSRGEFNVPYGEYDDPKIADPENIRMCSDALRSAELRCCSFLEIEAEISKTDFLYLDPPYLPVSATANFAAYDQSGFGLDEQIALRDFCRRMHERGVRFLLSNSHTDAILELYQEFEIEVVQAPRAINSKGDGRAKVNEVLVRNYKL